MSSQVHLDGNLTHDAEIMFDSQNRPRTKLLIAVNNRWNNAHGERVEDTVFLSVMCWGHLAERVAHLQKSDRVNVYGRLKERETGNGSKIEVHAYTVGAVL